VGDILIDANPITTRHSACGYTFSESLFYHPMLENETGIFYYLPVGNLVSYLTLNKTGLTPEEYANKKVFPFLGITQDDYEWYINRDGVNLGFHSLQMTTKKLASQAWHALLARWNG